MVEPDRVRIAADVAWVDLDDRIAVVRLSDPGADPLVLAGSAAEVWRVLGGAAAGGGAPSPAEVVERVAAAYDVDAAVVEADVLALLGQARRSQIVDPTTTE